MHIKETLKAYPIMEMLDVRFDTIKWSNQKDQSIGIGTLGPITIQLRLTSITYAEHSGINVIFATQKGDGFTEEFQNINTKELATIIGAVTNAVKDRLSNFEWEFITLTAKDNAETRLKLYVRIADRIVREYRGLTRAEFNIKGTDVTLITKLSSEETSLIIKQIKQDY